MNDLEEELLKALRYVIVARKIKCEHKKPAPDPLCARCIADAAIEKAERVRDYERRSMPR